MIRILDINAVASLISALFLLSLGTACLLSGRRGREWRILALFNFSLALSSVAALAASLSGDYSKILLAIRLAYFGSVLSVIFAVFYTEIISGTKNEVTFFNKRITSRSYWIIAGTLSVFLLIGLFQSELLVPDFEADSAGDIFLQYGPVGYILIAVISLGVIKISITMIRALTKATGRKDREFLGLNNIAFHLVYLPALILEIVQPRLGVPNHIIVFTAFPIAVTAFYIAIIRFQFARVDELTVGLERQVGERTTALKEAQAQLAQQDKMASLGLLVASVAHEINNPIGAVRSSHGSLIRAIDKLKSGLDAENSRIMRDGTGDALFGIIDKCDGVINEGTERIVDFVRRLRSFISLDKADLQIVDIHTGLDDAIMLIQPRISDRIKIIRRYEEIPPLQCMPRQINQAFLNLLVNAVQAISGRGEIVVSTWSDRETIWISIADTGSGIAAKNLNRIFEPGYTTKEGSEGIGLGLSISHQIIRNHRGRISVDSLPGRGTTVFISLPVYLHTPASGDIKPAELGERI